jgi:hypothetical protein
MSFIVQISPFVHLFTLKIVSPGPDGGFKRPQTPHCIPTCNVSINSYKNSASQNIESKAKIIINAKYMKETFPETFKE